MTYSCAEKMKAIFSKYSEAIASDVLATEFCEGENEDSREWDINGEEVKISLAKK